MATQYANLKRKFSTTEAGLTLLPKQWGYAEDTRRLVVCEDDGSTKRYYWDSTRLADQTGTYGAELIGIDGITGITPDGGSSGAAGTVRAMLRGLANRAGTVASDAVILAPAASSRNVVQPTGNFIPLTVRGHSTQAANLFQLENSSSVSLAAFTAAGNLSLSRTDNSDPVTVTIANGGSSDAQITMTAGSTWSFGPDNSDSDSMVYSLASSLGTNNRLKLWTTGSLHFGNAMSGSSGDVQARFNYGTNSRCRFIFENAATSGGSDHAQLIVATSSSGGNPAYYLRKGSEGNREWVNYLYGSDNSIKWNYNNSGSSDSLDSTALMSLDTSGNLTLSGSVAAGVGGISTSYGVGALGSANMERVSIFHASNYATIASEAAGSGTLRPLRLQLGDGGGYNTHLEIATTGYVGIGGTSSISHDLTVSKSASGVPVGLKVMNESSSADSDALIRIEVQGSSSGEAKLQWDKNGATYQMGTHATDNKFVFDAGGGALGASPVFEYDGVLRLFTELELPAVIEATPGSQVLTLTNGPAAASAGNPDTYITVKVTGRANPVAIPAWEL